MLTRELGLETHVKDVVATAEYLDLQDFLLVGHSYGGSVITAAAERLSERLAGMVYVDAVFPEDGENTWDKVKAFEEPFRKIADEIGDGYKMSITACARSFVWCCLIQPSFEMANTRIVSRLILSGAEIRTLPVGG